MRKTMDNSKIPEVQVYPSKGIRKTQFLRGPVPMDWLRRAAELGGNALEVAIVLWHKYGLCKGQPFKISNAEASLSGKSSDTGRRALSTLENEGLIAVQSLPGRKKIITIIEMN